MQAALNQEKEKGEVFHRPKINTRSKSMKRTVEDLLEYGEEKCQQRQKQKNRQEMDEYLELKQL